MKTWRGRYMHGAITHLWLKSHGNEYYWSYRTLKKITTVTKNWIAFVVLYKDYICKYSALYITSVWVLMVFLIFKSSHREKLYSIGDQHIGKDSRKVRNVSGSWWRKSILKKTFSVELFLENTTRQCFKNAKKFFVKLGSNPWKFFKVLVFTENKHRNRYFSKLFYEISRKFLGNLDSKNRFMVVVWGSIFSYSFLYILECVSTFWRVWGEHQVAGLHTIDKLQYQPKYFAQSKEIQ